MEYNITVFDIETTGLNPDKGDQIIEIGAIKLSNKKTFHSLVYAEIDDKKDDYFKQFFNLDEIKKASKIQQVIEQFIDFVQDDILAAHNADFDISFLKPLWETYAPFVEFPTTICTKEMDKIFFPDDKFHNLDVVCAKWDVKQPQNRHRALDDAIATAEVIQKMINSGKFSSIEDLIKKTAVHKSFKHKNI